MKFLFLGKCTKKISRHIFDFQYKLVLFFLKVLQCAYLRLSKSNVESLESMIRNKGSDPGIHIHSDVTDYDIWTGMKEERTDLQTQQKEKKGKRSKRPIKA